ncbi:monovalent cation:proton antiporter-2 (CPA2) family protein [Paludibacterium purpuratum]|uniref:Kef-type potassium/proton antiporter (CPA2 family) n=1 Tax=Paludibacterium purpuratum TaxID=1144873 RepID=A0A4V3DVN4_9NEIS|nr:monovalent cation:proton antiporter-2 (CPA2) family protein [Paludibacterium purpuratum]TDR81609.1 Kef-type potassium/proton antiporter (CPA2 family) [Paludibacterium purpuratum]
MHSLAVVVQVLLLVVLVITLCRRVRVPSLLAYLVIGFLAGPAVAGLVPQGEMTELLGEIGIVFLMFTIGLEFSLAKLKAMQQLVFGVGLLQVTLTMLLTGAVCYLATGSAEAAFALGGVLAMSSTAIVSRLLTEQRELGQPHGQLAIGVLLFQDIAVVPLLILLPAMAGNPEHLWQDLGLAAVKVVAVLTLLLVVGQRLVRPWFHLVARQRSSELFMLNVLLVTLGVAWLTELSGLSLALGAFVAGMLISETEYRYQVEEDIRPFRDLLLGFFFMTVGMRLSLPVLIEHFALVLLLVCLLLPVKLAVVYGVARLFGHRSMDAMRAGLALAQGGEFGFVLLTLAFRLDLIAQPVIQAAVAAVLLSMLIAPFVLLHGEAIARRLVRQDWTMQAFDLHHLLVESMSKNEHVLICGYGRSGQALARLLDAEDIPFFALDMDPVRIQEAADAGDPVVFGNASKTEVLLAAGIQRAKVMVISFDDTEAACRILNSVQRLRTDLPVIVRTVDDGDIDRLRAAGADEVVPELLEGSLMLASQALMEAGVPLARVLRRIRRVREERYGLFRGFFHGVDDIDSLEDEARIPRLQSVVLCEGAAAIGHPLHALRLDELGVAIKSMRSNHRRYFDLDQSQLLNQGDVLVLLGSPEQLARAEARILNG